MKKENIDVTSLAHTKWDCKYHTESRYNAAPLSDDMLELVSAAGEADDQSKLKKDGDTDDE